MQIYVNSMYCNNFDFPDFFFTVLTPDKKKMYTVDIELMTKIRLNKCANRPQRHRQIFCYKKIQAQMFRMFPFFLLPLLNT